MRTRNLFLTVFLFTFFAITGTHSAPLTWENAWQFGPSGAVEVDTARQLAFLASGGAVITLDISDPSNPVLVNKDIRTRGEVLDIHMDYDNQNLLLACDEAGLEIWDVMDINEPFRIGNIEIIYGGVETPVRHVDLYQDFAITENRWGYIHSIDISDPANPFQAGFNGIVGNPAHDISVSEDGYVHATGQQYYALLKINPDGSLSVAGSMMVSAGSIFGTTDATFMSLGGSLYIIDRTQPGSSTTSVSFHDIFVREGMAFLLSGDFFRVYDVSDIYNPVFMGQVEVNGLTSQVALMDNYALVSDGYLGLKVIDFSNPSVPVIAGEYEGTGVTWTSTTVDGISYTANSSSGLSVIDVSDPLFTDPVKMGGAATNAETRDVDIQNGMAYVADWTGGLRIFDISSPATPVEIGTVNDIQAWRVEAEEDILYLDEANANVEDTLRIYDISDPSNPVEIGSMILPDLVWDIVFYKYHLYVSNGADGLRIIDVSDPASPVEVGFLDLPDVLDTDIEGDIAYVASSDWDGGLVTVDISDPADPQIITIYNPQGWYHPSHVSVEGDFVMTGENFGELKLFDVSDPASPQELDQYTTSGHIASIETIGNYIYVSDAVTGLQILYNDLTTGLPDQPEPVSKATVYPNPVRETATFSIDLERATAIRAEVFDITGKLVDVIYEGELPAGNNTLRWNNGIAAGNALPTNTYFYRITGEGVLETGKFVVQK